MIAESLQSNYLLTIIKQADNTNLDKLFVFQAI